MFWRTSSPPVDAEIRDWIEKSFLWFIATFGEEHFLQHRTILPDQSFFPDKYDGTEESVLLLVERVCSFMDTNPQTIDVKFLVEHGGASGRDGLPGSAQHQGAAGKYFRDASPDGKRLIAINVSQFKKPTSLVATIAHELGHVILLGDIKISPEDPRHEYLTDLATVFFGLGIFTANSAVQFNQWQSYNRQGWSTSRLGYMSEEMFAYSLAACAWMRRETKVKWPELLTINIRHYFNASLKYLEKGGQTSLRQLGRPNV